MGTESVAEFCREIESYLCRKNDGHLIRVTGPSFDLVSGWAESGVPLKVAFEGIDRCFERYYRNGPRRRPVKIDFCEADVLDVFDEWRRATGVATATEAPARARHSLPEHLERIVTRLTSARASGSLPAAVDPIIDRVSAELDAARARPGGVRGDARTAAIARLEALDGSLVGAVRSTLDERLLTAMRAEAEAELAPFRAAMAGEAYARGRDAALDRLVRARFNLPVVTYTD